MKTKKILLLIPLAILIILSLWLLLRRQDPVTGEPAPGPLPFGAGESASIPSTLPPDFEGVLPSEEGKGNDSQKYSLFRITSDPVAGFGFISRGTTTLMRYADRATGHVFESSVTEDNRIIKKRLTNNTIPKVYEAHFRSDGGAVILRTLEEDSDLVKNSSLSLTAPTATSSDSLYTTSLTILRDQMESVAPGQNDNVFYLLKDRKEIVSSTFTGGNLRALLFSPFTNWRISPAGNNLLIFTKPSLLADGIAYTLSPASRLTKVAGPLKGLSAVGNGAGNRLLYSHNDSGSLRLFFKELPAGEPYEIFPSALADKCLWSRLDAEIFYCATAIGGFLGSEPDGWYQGRVSYSDYLWSYNLKENFSTLIVNPSDEYEVDLDFYEPKLSSREDYLAFINRKDLTLWAVRLK